MTALTLISKPYNQALRDAIATRLPVGMALDDLNIGQPRRMRSGEIRIAISIKSISYQKPNWSWYGSTELRHGQVDLSDLFLGCQPTFDPTSFGSTFTTEDVLTQLTQRYQIHFDTSDYLTSTYQKSTTASIVLEASPTSYRYRGKVNIHSANANHLNDILTHEGEPLLTTEGQPITL